MNPRDRKDALVKHSAEHFQVPVMNLVCAWCGSEQGVVPCEPAQAGMKSHGICPLCRERHLDQEVRP